MKRREDREGAAESARPESADAGEIWRPRGGANSKISAQAIAGIVPRITEKSFEKHGFAAASLIMDWSSIVGRERAHDTRPLKLKWPRGVDKFAEQADADRGRPGATLILQVDPAAALEVQYQAAHLIERINAYFGYRAVSELRIQQEPIEAPTPDTRPPTSPDPPSTQQVSTEATREPATDPLAAALERLGRHVKASSRRGTRG